MGFVKTGGDSFDNLHFVQSPWCMHCRLGGLGSGGAGGAIPWAGAADCWVTVGGLELGGIVVGVTIFAAGGVLSVFIRKWMTAKAATIPRRMKTDARYLPMGTGGALC